MTEKSCIVKNPLVRNGTSQQERLPAALIPSYVKVDEKQQQELILFAERLAEQLNYFNASNQLDENWKDFFQNDISVLCSSIALTDTNKIDHDYNQLTEAFHANPAKAEFKALFNFIIELGQEINSWYLKTPDGLTLKNDLVKYIQGDLSKQIITLAAYDKAAETLFPPDEFNTIQKPKYESFSAIWAIDVDSISPDFSIYTGTTDEDKRKNAVRFIKLIYEAFYKAYRLLVSKGPSYLNETLEKVSSHNPHVGLFLTFLRIFQNARDYLNTLTERHLKFYYEEVLGLVARGEVPDKVNVIFELAANVNSYLLKAGTALNAGKDSLGEDILFTIDNDIVLNKAQIRSLRTVFLDIPFTEKEEDEKIENIYVAPVANSSNGTGGKLAPGEAWPTLGESQENKSPDQRNMVDAEIGLAIASPILLLNDGDRLITLTITFQEAFDFPPTVDLTYLEIELRNNFRFLLSGEEGYIEKKAYNIRFIPDINPSFPQLEIQIRLEPSDPACVEYNDLVLEDHFDTRWPLLKLMVRKPDDKLEVTDSTLNVFAPPPGGYDFGSYIIYNAGIYKCESVGVTLNPEQDPGAWREMESIEEFYEDFRFNDKSQYNAFLPFYNPGDLVVYNRNIFRAKQLVLEGNPPPANINIETSNNNWELFVPEKFHPYDYFRNDTLQNIEILVDVKEAKELILQSDTAIIDKDKPFRPFGAAPSIDSAFLIGSREVFSKELESLKVNVEWLDLPLQSFKSYYNSYQEDDNITLSNNSFTASLQILNKRTWYPLENPDSLKLFETDGNDPINDAPKKTRTFIPEDLSKIRIKRDPYMEDFTEFSVSVKRGFIRLDLNQTVSGGVIEAFGHKEYPTILTNRVIEKNQTPSVLLPNPPYTPNIKSISVDYSSRVLIEMAATGNEREYENRIDQVFNIDVFGHREVHPFTEEENITFLPVIEDEGSLLIGLENLTPPQNLSLYFQFKEGTSNPNASAPEMLYSVLADNRWLPLPLSAVKLDTTNGLLRSGIVVLDIPAEITNGNSLIADTQDLYWIKVHVKDNADAISEALEVRTQGASATFQNNNNDPERLRTPLPAASINRLRFSQAAIRSVSQPFSSFGGKTPEESLDFYTRVSERLRHKSRTISIYDYERMVLENFPSVFRVKCLNHTIPVKKAVDKKDLLPNGGLKSLESLPPDAETSPGNVTVVVIADVRNQNGQNPLVPRVSIDQLDEIEKFLKEYSSPFLALDEEVTGEEEKKSSLGVENPIYEQILLSFEVAFHPGLDKSYYINQLNEDIKKYLSPWAYDASGDVDISFGGSIHQSVLINFIEERPYVGFLSRFRMFQNIITDGNNTIDVENIDLDKFEQVEEAVTHTSRSILVSASTHIISAIDFETASIECDAGGIGDMQLPDTELSIEGTFVIR